MKHDRPWSSVALLAAGLLLSTWIFATDAQAAQPTSSASTLTWDEAFPVARAAGDVHVDAHFQGSDGLPHRLQVWRHGTAFLHRRTDETLDLYVHRSDTGADYAYRLLDHRRHIVMDVRRNQLYRIGVFSDWFGLAHLIDRPKTAFSVRALSVPPHERRPDCIWRLLVRGTKTAPDESHVCWSSTWGIPLALRTKDAKGEWIDLLRVDRIEAIPPSTESTTMPASPDGYATFDASNEIDPKEGD